MLVIPRRFPPGFSVDEDGDEAYNASLCADDHLYQLSSYLLMR